MTLRESAASLVRACRYQGEIASDYEEWSEYREQITGYLLDRIEPGSSVAIYGAGYCNDIDLRILSQHAGHITLIDVNDRALQTARSKYGLSSEAVSCLRYDLVPIPDEVYEEFAEKCLELILLLKGDGQKCDGPKCKEQKYDGPGDDGQKYDAPKCDESWETEILSWVENSYERLSASLAEEASEPDVKADCTVMLGLHSQLNNVFSGILSVLIGEAPLNLRAQLTDLLIKVESIQRRYTPKLISHVNRIAVNHTSHTILTSYEVAVYRAGQTYDGTLNSQNEDVEDDRESEDGHESENGHESEDGHELKCNSESRVSYEQVDGAYDVPYSIRELCSEGHIQVTEVARVMWPISKARELSYEMELCRCEVLSSHSQE